MKTNINNDNYEVYLLDYMEGNLGSDETAQLKAIVAAQGLDWVELTEELPHLEAPELVYQDKDSLKPTAMSLSQGQPNNSIPLYAKIASVAAAAGLLLTIGLWPEKSMPSIEPVVELSPIEAHLTLGETIPRLVPRRTVPMDSLPSVPIIEDNAVDQQAFAQSHNASHKVEYITSLSPLKPRSVSTSNTTDDLLVSDFTLLRYHMEARQAFSYLPEALSYEKEMPASLIGRGIYWMTEGRHSNLGDLINAGLHLAKKEAVKVTTDAALTAYYRADEHLDDIKEHWQEKHGE